MQIIEVITLVIQFDKDSAIKGSITVPNESLSSIMEGVRLKKFLYVHQRNHCCLADKEFYQMPPTFRAVFDSAVVQG